jgi:TonB family protein
MNTIKSHLIIAVAVICGVAFGVVITTAVQNAKKQDSRQEQSLTDSKSDSDTSAILTDTLKQESAAADVDTSSPQSKPPVLKISGKENPDVYLQSLDIQVDVTGSIASTRYTMIFKNKTGRILEGELTFPLPDGRTVTYYALDINGRMREAVPVEKAKGTEVFEEIEQRRVDPGLLERVEGNNFRTRIYPIPAYGTRTIAIGYEEELALEKSLLNYRLPMAYPDSLEKFAVKATVWKSGLKPLVPESENGLSFDKVGENYVAAFTREKYRPARSLNFAMPAPVDIPQIMMQPAQGSYYFFASVTPKFETRNKQWNNDLAIIWDVSLSGSQRDLKRELEMLDIIFAAKREANVHLYFLNNKFKKAVNKGTGGGEYKVSNGKWEELKKVLETAIFDGGTDFSKINMNDITGNEILFFSDGISTLSDADFLKNAAANRPIHCVVSSAKADYSAMRLIAGKSKGKFINANALSSEKLKNELLNETLQFLGTEHGKSVREVYPAIATPVHGNFSSAGISDTSDAELTLLFGFGGKVEKRITVRLDAKSAGSEVNAHKIWAQKKIAELDLNYEKNRVELTALGQQFGIVTRNTSLIVLESVDDYIRYNITPPAAEKELYAEYQRRTKGVTGQKSSPQPARAMTSVDAFGRGGFATDIDAILSNVGGLKSGGDGGTGRRGVAGIGYGSGYGSGFGGGGGGVDDLLGGLMGGSGGGLELKKKGELKVSSADFLKGGALTGGRNRASIQRVVMQNMAALRYAYNKRLREKPGLCGKVMVKFAIDEFGKVVVAQMVESTINDSTFEQTVVARVKSWNFEKIDKPGDVTDVTYPFVFSNDVPCSNMTIPSTQTNERADSVRQERRMAATASGKVDSFEVAMDRIDQQAKERTVREKAEREAREKIEQARRQAQEKIEQARERAERQAAERAERQERERAEQQQARERVMAWNRDTLNGAVMAAEHIRRWWNTDFSSSRSRYPTPDDNGVGRISGTGSAKGGFVKNTDYLKKMTGKTADDYQTYLEVRKDYANSPTFYFNMASWFYTCGDKETAIRVLTSIADLELENAALYRLLGYRLKEFGEYALEKFVCYKVVQWRPMEPQSHRDYANALADNGEAQAALNTLYGVLTRTYSSNIRNRSRGISEVTVTEINRLIARYPNLNKSKIYKGLLTNIPVDVRVVINWNMNSTDIDLHVLDPNGEECYFRHRETEIGGRISPDVTDGYGPEQFLLKKAVRGKYRVYVNYYGDRQVTDAGPSTIMAEIYTKYADKSEKRKVVCLQMSNVTRQGDGNVQVAEFDF